MSSTWAKQAMETGHADVVDAAGDEPVGAQGQLALVGDRRV